MLWVLLLFLVPFLLILLPVLLGLVSPESYEATVEAEIDAPPDTVFRMLEDVSSNPGSGAMTKSVETLPREEWQHGLPAWIEDLGSTRIRVQTVQAEPGRLLVRELEDEVVPMRARWTLELEPNGAGTLLTATNETTISKGTWHVPLFRFLMRFMNGARRGLVHFLTRLGRSLECDIRFRT
ncbi:MAG: SRPBCC family protein [Planctomycetota bacterium]|jgi:hypothetical protein